MVLIDEMESPLLDLIVGYSLGLNVKIVDNKLCMGKIGEDWHNYSPSNFYSQGMPIIEQNQISIIFSDGEPDRPDKNIWIAFSEDPSSYFNDPNTSIGKTPLIAGMRYYAKTILGVDAISEDHLEKIANGIDPSVEQEKTPEESNIEVLDVTP